MCLLFVGSDFFGMVYSEIVGYFAMFVGVGAIEEFFE